MPPHCLPPFDPSIVPTPEGQSLLRTWELLCRRGDQIETLAADLDRLAATASTAASLATAVAQAKTATAIVQNKIAAAIVNPNDPNVPLPEGEGPGPGPTPDAPDGGIDLDPQPSSIDLNSIIWLHTDPSGWAVTSTLQKVYISTSSICINHTKAGLWPTSFTGSVEVEGNPWVIAYVNGQWYGATYEWLRPGQICKNVTAANIGAHIKKSPLDTWVPQGGELVGFLVSTRARDGGGYGDERSQIVEVTWPAF